MFNALLIENDDPGYRATMKELDESDLPAGNVTVGIDWSTINYKDALAITGKGGAVVRAFPMVPGIDFAGTVLSSDDPDYKIGDAVLLNGWGVGEKHWGGLAQRARVPGDWLIPMPDGIDPRSAMAIGTAGYTAMLCVIALEKHGLRPSDGEILVTGASGGVGSFAISLLARLGYRVVASTGRLEEADYLRELGAEVIIHRSDLSAPGKPLQKERWIGAVDSVGSHTLANVCASMQSDGVVTACGLAQGMDFPSTVAPFILRGVSLIGINSVTRPKHERIEAWNRLAKDFDVGHLDTMIHEIRLHEAVKAANDLLSGSIRGRLVVNVGNP